MTSTHRPSGLLLAIPTLLLAAAASGQSFEAAFEGPSADRWNYGFNVTPGTRPVASVFGYTGDLYEFDDRDGQVIIAFETSDVIAPGAGADRYVVDTFTIEFMLADPLAGGYDPTVDDWRTHLDSDDPRYLPDADPGRPIELFATGFRNRVNEADWTESSDFSPVGPFGEGVRNAFAAQCMPDGQLLDVSNCISEEFTATPLAIGTAAGWSPGEELPEGTPLSFTFDGADPAAAAWLSRSLNEGRLLFSISSLIEAEQEGGDFIDLYMRENPLVQVGVRQAATLLISGEISAGCDAEGDFDHDCVIGGGDLGIFLAFWGTDNPETDLNNDGVTNGTDLGILLSLF
ncbi:MAG: hypothetical protein P8J59_05030 [Phycisphaerales bacterium]|jgi:hypothetical protein|nr:hypothetical protein [Phycisphaerales bacterium]